MTEFEVTCVVVVVVRIVLCTDEVLVSAENIEIIIKKFQSNEQFLLQILIIDTMKIFKAYHKS
jgi:hypothetical protein